MSSIKLLKTIGVGKGMTMTVSLDESEPEDSINRYIMDTTCTGEEVLHIPPHWHKNHAEHLSVLEGRFEVTLGGDKIILTPEDPPILVPRRVVHSMRTFGGEKVVFRERPDPTGIHKALFFNDIFSEGHFGGIWHSLRAFYDGDTYLALPFYFRLVDEVFITVFGGIAHLFVAPKPKKL